MPIWNFIKEKMGNQSAKNRHTSGEDPAPSLTAGRYVDPVSGSFQFYQEGHEPANYKVRAMLCASHGESHIYMYVISPLVS